VGSRVSRRRAAWRRPGLCGLARHLQDQILEYANFGGHSSAWLLRQFPSHGAACANITSATWAQAFPRNCAGARCQLLNPLRLWQFFSLGIHSAAETDHLPHSMKEIKKGSSSNHVVFLIERGGRRRCGRGKRKPTDAVPNVFQRVL
jgi:hypothetical protein